MRYRISRRKIGGRLRPIFDQEVTRWMQFSRVVKITFITLILLISDIDIVISIFL